MDPGVTIYRTATSQLGILAFNSGISDAHVYANGARLVGQSGIRGSTVRFIGATRCTLHDAWIDSSGSNIHDGAYFGTDTNVSPHYPATDCAIYRGRITDAQRNGVSLVGANRCLIDGVEISGTTGAPGRGVDVEANNHDDVVAENIIRNCWVHDNENAGIGVSFGWRTWIENNLCEGNDRGISVASGANTRNEDFYRPNIDVMGVSAFDTVNGWITVGGDLELLPIGLNVQIAAPNGHDLPSGMVTTAYAVCEHQGTDQIRIGISPENNVETSWGDAGNGTGNADPNLSDYRMNVYGGEGQSDDSVVINNRCFNNVREGIYAALLGSIRIEGNELRNNVTGATEIHQIQVLYCHKPIVIHNQIVCDYDTDTSRGITISRAYGAIVYGNEIRGTGQCGIMISGSSYTRLTDNLVQNTGKAGGSPLDDDSSCIRVTTCAGVLLRGNVCRHDESYGTVLYGIRLDAQTDDCSLVDNMCVRAGPDVAGSISLSGSGHVHSNNRRYDGTIYT